jgi:hypothetical protein
LAKLCSYYGTTNIVEALINLDCKKAMEQENVARLRDENGVETFQLFHGKMEFCQTEMEMDFFCESGNENRTTFSGGTNTKMELPFPTDAEFLFSSGFAWSI